MTLIAAEEAAAQAVRLLIAKSRTIGTAESLTGGLVASVLTSVPGASAVFRGGIVAYAADLKETLLGVPASLLDRVGTVHADVALAMARGVTERLGVQVGIGTTGVAGPDPVDDHRVGTVHIAIAGPGQLARHAELRLTGDRDQIRRDTVREAITLLVAVLLEDNT